MEFSPDNNVVKRCMQGMDLEEKGKPIEALTLFLQAWNDATNDFEKFTAAFYVARHQRTISDKLKWLETALQFALRANSHSVKAALSSLYLNIARCYEDLRDIDNAKMNHELAISLKDKLSDKGPFYHGTKADLQIGDLLTAGGRSNYKAQNLIKSMNVEVVCTTDDPVDDLLYHQQIRQQQYSTKVLPAWRPDKAMAAEDPEDYNRYLDRLSAVSGMPISKYDDLLHALSKRQAFFNSMGCKLSDHGLATFYASDYTELEIKSIFSKVRSGNHLSERELLKYKSALLMHFAEMNHSFGWTQQFHIGALRNNNTKMLKLAGTDKGYDSIGDFNIALMMSKFLDRLSQHEKLTRTIVYNLNPSDNEIIVTMLGNFNDETTPGKMQYGSAWWFLDQKHGMEAQLKALSNMGLLARFIGMTTDSRSFVSYTRHEYFRRILCNLIGTNVENGEIPADMNWLGKVVQGICYYNAKEYFTF